MDKIKVTANSLPKDWLWSPIIGANTLKMGGKLSDDEKQRLKEESHGILASCLPPGEDHATRTGLVIGYVQSGKTLSFTTVSALARDNKYPLVIVLGGTTNPLVSQSNTRLMEDLGIKSGREWKVFTTKDGGLKGPQIKEIDQEFEKWRNGSKRAKTILLVAMKNHSHFNKLSKAFIKCNLDKITALVIDDEGDQAGLNSKVKKNEESTTYSRIRELRDALPRHSYVLYTATPQAPLLISRIDFLSPEFARVLTPGDSYIGGKELFYPGSKYVKIVPYDQIPDVDEPPRSPPQTLIDALLYFFIGVAIGFINEEDMAGENRSMMIHPSIKKDGHKLYSRWVSNIRNRWSNTLKQDPADPSYKKLISDFKVAYKEIIKTDKNIPEFESIMEELSEVIQDATIEELNTRHNSKIPSINWSNNYSHILIGGIGLDRGFTVEGLTVSYMPRSIGVGNSDNIQQRARFFGYKSAYKGLCRIFVDAETEKAFINYVDHEEHLRSSIIKFIKQGKSLKEWKRAFLLSPELNLTRDSVISDAPQRATIRNGWMVPQFPHIEKKSIDENRVLVDNFINKHTMQEYSEEGWNDKQIVPKYSNAIPLKAAYKELLLLLSFVMPPDDLNHMAMMTFFEELLEADPNQKCTVYAFASEWSGNIVSTRSLDNNYPPRIKNLFQGSNAKTNYPGMRQIFDPSTVTIQIHRYDLKNPSGAIVMKDVPVIVLHLPDGAKARHVIIQNEK